MIGKIIANPYLTMYLVSVLLMGIAGVHIIGRAIADDIRRRNYTDARVVSYFRILMWVIGAFIPVWNTLIALGYLFIEVAPSTFSYIRAALSAPVVPVKKI